jgi:hypothetical protein
VCIFAKLVACFSTLEANPNMQLTDIITPAELAGLQKGKQITESIIADEKYPVLIYLSNVITYI